jgi:hypothetical protein
VCIGDASQNSLEISNTGSENLVLFNVERISGDEDIEVLDFPGVAQTIIPGAEVGYTVQCAPESAGPKSAIIRIESNDPDQPNIDIEYMCGVGEPDLNVSIANSGGFGEVCAGDQGELGLSLLNQGTCDLTIDSITSDNPAFVLPDSTQFPLVLSHDADFNLSLRFEPESCDDAGETGTITIVSDSPGENVLEIDVNGTASCPELVIDPPEVTGVHAFPATVVDVGEVLGCYSERTVVVRNAGTCPMTISGMDAGGTDFTVVQPTQFPIVLPGGEETLEATVRFTPQDGGDPTTPDEVLGTLSVSSDDPDAAGTADLCGEGVVQSGVRILVTDVSGGSPVVVDPIGDLRIRSKGKNTPSPINLRFRNQPATLSTVCENSFNYHVNLESLPSAASSGSNQKASYAAKAKEGNLQTEETFELGQCDFLDFQIQLTSQGGNGNN